MTNYVGLIVGGAVFAAVYAAGALFYLLLIREAYLAVRAFVRVFTRREAKGRGFPVEPSEWSDRK